MTLKWKVEIRNQFKEKKKGAFVAVITQGILKVWGVVSQEL